MSRSGKKRELLSLRGFHRFWHQPSCAGGSAVIPPVSPEQAVSGPPFEIPGSQGKAP